MNLSTEGRAVALLPFLLFVALFVGTGTYLSMQGVDFAFYQLKAPIAIMPAIVLAVFLSRDKLNDTIESFIGGVGDKSIIAMCLIYLLAGAFSSVAKATGGVDATVALGLSVVPAWFLLPGIFIISGFIATAMGTSMGTIGAVAPIALGVAESAGIPLPLMAGAVLSGAIFGDNLSIISDTTIAATRTQGCEMKDKFKENIYIALPAALVAGVLFFVLSGDAVAPASTSFAWLNVVPYLAILLLAISGLNVFVVLVVGLVLAGGVGIFTVDGYTLGTYVNDIYAGFSGMQEIFLLSLLIGGLGALMEKQGGLTFIKNAVTSGISRISGGGKDDKRTAELGIASCVALTNLCTANNTVAIIVTAGVAKDMAGHAGVTPRRSASLLDIFSCIIQGLIPWGAQLLLLGSVFALSPVGIVQFSFYPMLLALSALASILFKRRA